MCQYRIFGGKRLCGELRIGGAKNAILPILAAVCLNKREMKIHNCPRIADVFATVEILESLGFAVKFSENTMEITPVGVLQSEIPEEFAKKMRSSILFMGALLAKTGRVQLALPGGCKLGERAINLHIAGLEAMGATIIERNGILHCETSKKGLHGAKIRLAFPSVGATENLLIAATMAKGETFIENAAKEPEIADLAAFLKKMGAEIRGAGTGNIYVKGNSKFDKEITHTTIPDRIVVGTYLLAAAMTGGEITLAGVRPFDLSSFTSYLSEMGCKIRAERDCVTLCAPSQLLSFPRIVTKVHPGFPTDMQAQFVAAMTIAHKRCELTETIFEGRCSHVSELRKMGASIHLTANKRTFTIDGVKKLRGATVTAHDLRCGAAMVLAGLAAEGETVVQNAHHVERGYEDIERDLTLLGGEIKLKTPKSP